MGLLEDSEKMLAKCNYVGTFLYMGFYFMDFTEMEEDALNLMTDLNADEVFNLALFKTINNIITVVSCTNQFNKEELIVPVRNIFLKYNDLISPGPSKSFKLVNTSTFPF